LILTVLGLAGCSEDPALQCLEWDSHVEIGLRNGEVYWSREKWTCADLGDDGGPHVPKPHYLPSATNALVGKVAPTE